MRGGGEGRGLDRLNGSSQHGASQHGAIRLAACLQAAMHSDSKRLVRQLRRALPMLLLLLRQRACLLRAGRPARRGRLGAPRPALMPPVLLCSAPPGRYSIPESLPPLHPDDAALVEVCAAPCCQMLGVATV